MQTPICEFGTKAVDFALPGIDGKVTSLSDVAGAKATLVMFLCNHCPYVKAVISRLVRDVGDLKRHGVGAVAIMSNDWVAYPEDSLENMARFAEAHAFPFPYLIDETQATARAYGAICTPDFFGFNQALELQYRGRLDAGHLDAQRLDAQRLDAKRLDPEGRESQKRELFEAMAAIARTGKGPSEQVASMGCSIKWRESD